MKPALEFPPATSTARIMATDRSVSSPPKLSWLVGFAAFVVIAAILPLVIGQYYLYVVTQVMIYAVATLGLDILYGRTGQLSLAHASFFGVGAYVAALASSFGVPVLLQPVLVLGLAIVVGALVAVPTLRCSSWPLIGYSACMPPTPDSPVSYLAQSQVTKGSHPEGRRPLVPTAINLGSSTSSASSRRGTRHH